LGYCLLVRYTIQCDISYLAGNHLFEILIENLPFVDQFIFFKIVLYNNLLHTKLDIQFPLNVIGKRLLKSSILTFPNIFLLRQY
jgi:hypothetical protein